MRSKFVRFGDTVLFCTCNIKLIMHRCDGFSLCIIMHIALCLEYILYFQGLWHQNKENNLPENCMLCVIFFRNIILTRFFNRLNFLFLDRFQFFFFFLQTSSFPMNFVASLLKSKSSIIKK